MSEIRKFTVIYYGYMRQCPSTIHSHLEHLYMPFPESRMVFSVWSRLWDSSPVPHPSFDIDASLDLLPRWVEGRLAGWNVNTPDPHSMQEVVRVLHIPEVNCFGQPTWRVVSYCKSLQEAARFALSSSADEHFLFCRPDLRFEADLRPHIPDGCDCASNCGIDWFHDGGRRLGQAPVKGMKGRGFLDQLYLMNRKATERMSSIFDSVGDMWKSGVEINYETLVGWHLHRAGITWTSANMGDISLVRPRAVVDGKLHIIYPGSVGPATEN